jgi:16S rRNA (guanine966-N2)-methyltransferase
MAERGAGRIIAGAARGIQLESPGHGTRPMGDRVKQTLFAILGADLADASVLDLYAGSGAAGLEALSRGAARATFVDHDRRAISSIRANLARTHLDQARAAVVRADALDWLRGTAADGSDRFDIVIVDPPYADANLLLASLERVGPCLAPAARVVAKHFWRDRPPERIGLLASERERRFGETSLTFYRRREDR